MALTDALIQIKNVDHFRVKVNVDVAELDPMNPPATFRGIFGELDLKWCAPVPAPSVNAIWSQAMHITIRLIRCSAS